MIGACRVDRGQNASQLSTTRRCASSHRGRRRHLKIAERLISGTTSLSSPSLSATRKLQPPLDRQHFEEFVTDAPGDVSSKWETAARISVSVFV
jgi:hypothetical protein